MEILRCIGDGWKVLRAVAHIFAQWLFHNSAIGIVFRITGGIRLFVADTAIFVLLSRSGRGGGEDHGLVLRHGRLLIPVEIGAVFCATEATIIVCVDLLLKAFFHD